MSFQGQVGLIGGTKQGPQFTCRERDGTYCYAKKGCDCLVDPESFFAKKNNNVLLRFLCLLVFIYICNYYM